MIGLWLLSMNDSHAPPAKCPQPFGLIRPHFSYVAVRLGSGGTPWFSSEEFGIYRALALYRPGVRMCHAVTNVLGMPFS